MRRPFIAMSFATLCLAACGGKSLTLGGDASGGKAGAQDSGRITFVPEQAYAQALAVDETRLYWLTGYSALDPEVSERPARVRSCLKNDCSKTLVDYDSWPGAGLAFQGFPRDPFKVLSASAGRVYWARVTPDGTYEILGCPSSGCGGAPPVLATTSIISSLASDAEAIYWASQDDQAIVACAAQGCDKPKIIAKTNTSEPKGVSVDASFVYWIDRDSEDNWAVLRTLKDGTGTPETLTAGLNQPASLSLNSRFVSFSSRYAVGNVAYCPLSGCSSAPTLVASEQPYPLSIASDEHSVYFLNAPPRASTKSAALMRSSFDDSEPSEIDVITTPEMPSDRAIAVDEAFVYWISWGQKDRYLEFPHANIQRAAK